MCSNHQRVMLPLALISLISASAAFVPPPTDVSVSCHNLQTVVTWRSSEQQPASSFRVKVSGSEGYSETVTLERRYDLSRFVWQSKDHLLGFHYVNVTAMQGGHESKTVTSQTFTYNDDTPADIKCALDFPPVDLSVDGSEVTVRFPNPLHWYAKLKDVAQFFDFSVTAVGGGAEFNRRCHKREEACRLDVTLREGEEHQCVRLRGDVLSGRVLLAETQDVCHQQSADFHVATLAVLLSLLTVVIAVIIVCVCRAKAWTMKSPPLPKLLVLPHRNTGKRVMDLERDVVSRAETIAVNLASNKSCSSLTVSSEEEDDPSQRRQTSARHPPAPAYEDGQLSREQEAAGLISTRCEDEAEDDLSDDSLKTDILVLDLEDDEEDEEETGSVYDCPHMLDMGDGDMVECYGGR